MKTAGDVLRGFGHLLILGLVVAAGGCVGHHVTAPRVTLKQTYQETEARSLDFANVQRLTSTTRNGAVTLRGQASPSGRLEIRKTVRAASRDEARNFAATIRVDVEQVGTGLVVTPDYPTPPRGVEVQVDFEFRAPEDIALEVQSVNGTISLEGIYGEATANVTNGRIEIVPAARPGGPVAATVVNGTLAVGFPSGVAFDVTATTVNGCIVGGIGDTVVNQCRPDQEVHLGEEGGTPYQLRVVNGNIEVNRP